LLSALALYVSTGLGTTWQVAWVAPIPVLLFALQSSRLWAFMAGLGAFWLGSGTLYDAYDVGGWILLGLPSAAGFAAAILAANVAARRIAGPWAALAFPAALTSFEFLFSLISPNGTAWSLAYSQVDFLALLQLTSLTGLWGVVFALALVPSAVAFAWHRRAWSPLVPAAALLPVLAFGIVRLGTTAEPTQVRAGLAATDLGQPAAAITTDEAAAVAAARDYAARVATLAAQGAEIVVLPEKIIGVTPQSMAAVQQVFSDVARSARVAIVVGLSYNGIAPKRNVSWVFSADGARAVEYDKRHLVPFLEGDFQRGDVPAPFAGPGAQWGVAICKDLDFPGWLREYGNLGVRILAVPAWDFFADGRMHSRMAVVRGVENGFAVIRSAQGGVVTVSDAYGRVLVEQSSATDPQVVQSVAAGPGATFYTRYADWFGWLSVFLTVVVPPVLMRAKRKVSRSGP
jgi:apolipoprotein N-acyltransferase